MSWFFVTTLMEMIIASVDYELAEWTVRMKRASAIRMSSGRDSAPIPAWLVPSKRRDWSRWLAAAPAGRGCPLPPPLPPPPTPLRPHPPRLLQLIPAATDLVAKRRWIGAASTSGFCCLIAFWSCRTIRRWRRANAAVSVNYSHLKNPWKTNEKFP